MRKRLCEKQQQQQRKLPSFQRLSSVLCATGDAGGPGRQTHPLSGRDGGDVLLCCCHDSRHETPGWSSSTSLFPAKSLTITPISRTMAYFLLCMSNVRELILCFLQKFLLSTRMTNCRPLPVCAGQILVDELRQHVGHLPLCQFL